MKDPNWVIINIEESCVVLSASHILNAHVDMTLICFEHLLLHNDGLLVGSVGELT